MINQAIYDKINLHGALNYQHPVHYPEKYKGRVPFKIKMLKTVVSDLPWWLLSADKEAREAVEGNEYYVHVNSYGAVTVIFEDGKTLGVKPKEFEVIEWHPQSETEI